VVMATDRRLLVATQADDDSGATATGDWIPTDRGRSRIQARMVGRIRATLSRMNADLAYLNPPLEIHGVNEIVVLRPPPDRISKLLVAIVRHRTTVPVLPASPERPGT
jgi:hypothetical protein